MLRRLSPPLCSVASDVGTLKRQAHHFTDYLPFNEYAYEWLFTVQGCVVVEPFLCCCLREHQRQGVQFMYECVTGLVCPALHQIAFVVTFIWILTHVRACGHP